MCEAGGDVLVWVHSTASSHLGLQPAFSSPHTQTWDTPLTPHQASHQADQEDREDGQETVSVILVDRCLRLVVHLHPL